MIKVVFICCVCSVYSLIISRERERGRERECFLSRVGDSARERAGPHLHVSTGDPQLSNTAVVVYKHKINSSSSSSSSSSSNNNNNNKNNNNNSHSSNNNNNSDKCFILRPISLLGFWTSEGLTRAESRS